MNHGPAGLPLALLFVAFLLTFVITRTITRMIRAGRGPFRNNVSGGVHIHHAVPGIILLIIGAVTSVAADGASPVGEIAAVLIGVGASLVLDEFAMILHMQDVYWSREGQLSVQVVALTVAALGLLVLGFDPFTSDDEGAHFGAGHVVLLVILVVHVGALLACVAKGKYSTAVIGAYLPPVAWIGAIRLARPHSRWARRHYSKDKQERAAYRTEHFDARFGGYGLRLADLVAGKPSQPDPGPSTAAS
ncbi:hypothetical protein [Gordonia aichiensis]|uniref:Integral membrane protein n=1 Tax=Gordonia aichiensis NBRC 108223 TaxID=1220583 RepID=L7KN45_9ACTN|nr:hypothetical protein [Gordonia aichiensis]GAC50295.1 hypothetical protein GOACH_23_00040 [Gordonia aichiensis NBRC 108223]